MGYSLQIDSDFTVDLASNQGYADLCGWVRSLPNAPAIAHLVKFGWTGDVKDAGEQLAAALKSAPPARPDVRSTAAALAATLRAHASAEVATVTDGMGAEE